MNIDLDSEKIVKLYIEDKLSILAISKIFGVNPGTIKLRLERKEIKLRTHSENQKIALNRNQAKKNISIASKESSLKRKETNLKKYNTEVPANNINIKKDWQEEHFKKYGYNCPNQRHEIIEKIKNTCIDRYGEDNVSKVNFVKKKIKENRWNNKTEVELKEISEKIKNTWNENYPEGHPLRDKEIQDKIINTNLETRNVTHVSKDPEVKKRVQETRIKNSKNKIKSKLNLLNLELIDDFKNVIDTINIKCIKCNTIFKTVLDYVFHGYGLCPKCFPVKTSKAEAEIRDFIISLIGEDLVHTNCRNFLSSGKEIDILIPSKLLALEFDGLYYHQSDFVGKDYHINKTNECEKLGFRLIHIFEDEWMFKKDIVKERLKNILGLSNGKRIHARKCTIKEINTNEKNSFLEKFHIQGSDISKIKLGAFYDNKLISVMTFSYGNISKGSKKIEDVLELNRFCSNYNYHIPGIASKLLTYFKRNYKWKEIFSYADRRWSHGNLYYKLGFKLNHITKPNYWYTKGYIRIHRFNLRKKSTEPKEVSESILRYNEGYRKVWDCGNLKFTITN